MRSVWLCAMQVEPSRPPLGEIESWVKLACTPSFAILARLYPIFPAQITPLSRPAHDPLHPPLHSENQVSRRQQSFSASIFAAFPGNAPGLVLWGAQGTPFPASERLLCSAGAFGPEFLLPACLPCAFRRLHVLTYPGNARSPLPIGAAGPAAHATGS